MPKAKPVSLYPLTFDQAIDALIKVKPQRLTKAKRKRKPNRKN